jgi:hypothetical protein
MSELPNITSDYAILDVKKGRGALTKHFAKRPRLGECPPEFRVPVVITGYIEDVYSTDDGVSREFSVTVESLVVAKAAS